MDNSFSIIIPTLNNKREKNFSLYFTIKSILLQNYTDYEIIIVDSGCTDDTIDKIIELSNKISVIDAKKHLGNLSLLRNLGAKKSICDNLIFLDDDTILIDINTLNKLNHLINGYDFLCGANRQWSSPYWYKNITTMQSITSSIETLKNISFLPKGIDRTLGFRDLNEFTFIGNFGILKKDVFLKTNGFNEQFNGWGLEDVEYMMRLTLSEYKYSILSNHDIDVIHLTHPANNSDNYLKNLKLFNDIELKLGYYFHINHFFGIYEGDGSSLFTKID